MKVSRQLSGWRSPMNSYPRFRPAILVAALLVTASGCTQRQEVGSFSQETTDAPEAADAPENTDGPMKLDVLFVVDDSGSMLEEQTSLVTNFQLLIDQLENLPGGLPSVHVGVVSTDMGAGGYPISGCVGTGDAGAFQSAPQGACTPPTGEFISDIILPDDTREQNYTDTLAETFACIAQLGVNGCGYEQPLESMRAALDSATGAEFVRDGAFLAVVILTDEDDCSASDSTLFDTNQNDISDPLGPLTSFRCVEFGVTCDGGALPRTAGNYAACEPLEPSPYLYGVTDYVDHLLALKGNDGSKVIVSVIAGNRDAGLDVEISPTNAPAAQHTCSSAAGNAYGAFRLGAFADAFSNNLFTSICNPDLTGALQATAVLITNSMDGTEDPNPNPDPNPDPDPAADAGCNTSGGGASSLALALFALVLIISRRRRRAR